MLRLDLIVALLALCLSLMPLGIAQAHTDMLPKGPKKETKGPEAAKVAKKKGKASKKAKGAAKAKKKPLKKKLALKQWLKLGPVTAPMPLFHKEKYGKYTYKRMLMGRQLPIVTMRPEAGTQEDWFLGQSLTWKKATPGFGTQPKQAKASQKTSKKQAIIGYFATYLQVNRYLELQLQVRSHHMMRIFHNGRLIGTKAHCTKQPKKKKGAKQAASKPAKASPESRKVEQPKQPPQAAKGAGGLIGRLAELLAEQGKVLKQQAKIIAAQQKLMAGGGKSAKRRNKAPKRGKAQAMLRLTPGVHRLLIKSLWRPGCVWERKLKAEAKVMGKKESVKGLLNTLRPQERHSIPFLLRRARITGSVLTPDGKEVVVSLMRKDHTGKTERWVEWRRVKDGTLLHMHRPPARVGQMRWSPDGRTHSYATYSRKGVTLWLVNRATKEVKALRRNIKHFQYYLWAPNSKYLLLGRYRKQKPSKAERVGAKRLRGMNDRWPWYRNRAYFSTLSVKTGSLVRITAGRWDLSGPRIRPDGKAILFLRSIPDYNKRPFTRYELIELSLPQLQPTVLLKDLHWIRGYAYSPNGKKLLIQGSASMFKGLGRQLPKGVVPNEYDQQLYIYNRATKKARCLTLAFRPTVSSSIWHPKDGQIYFTALDQTRVRLYKYNRESNKVEQLASNADLIGRVSFARKSTQVTYIGQGVAHPGRLYTLDLHNPKPRLLLDPAKAWFSRLTLAKVKDFVTKSKKGVRLQGRVYYPPNFNPKKKYPAIVYYYGGTYPTTRSFDGRYPGHLWAAHGFVVYKLQPSGAIGFGQRHSARHVNEWGSTVAQEIIGATKDFLKAHSFVDPKRVGCIGASYGGFMTMSIVTKTSLFAAAISHAGISNLTSYWGAGFWGFLYSSIATAHYYPWSHRSFYINNSPLFSAHQVTTPLLLLHGSADNNVPPGESYQMYTALRLLKKKVEIVLFKKEGHWVLRYRKRIIWTRTILAWFSKHLKKQPLWWKRLHGTKQH